MAEMVMGRPARAARRLAFWRTILTTPVPTVPNPAMPRRRGSGMSVSIRRFRGGMDARCNGFDGALQRRFSGALPFLHATGHAVAGVGVNHGAAKGGGAGAEGGGAGVDFAAVFVAEVGGRSAGAKSFNGHKLGIGRVAQGGVNRVVKGGKLRAARR